ncbi:MAG: HDOD domain-containing protein [Syntrophorhabdales bacterium]|jgi:putative nucleotidyltransferase with HDIG domain
MVDHIRDRINQIEFLPTCPSIVSEVIGTMEDPKSSASDLVRHMDPSLAGEVLRAANKAYVGKHNFRHIVTVEQAIAAIGHSGLSSIVLHTPFLSMIDGDDALFDREGFVRHSVSCAILAGTVSEAFGLGDPPIAHISGMLHDVGIIIAYQFFKEEWHSVNLLMEQKKWKRIEAEREVFGTDHAEIGSMLLESWNIPEKIVDAVRLHHRREETGEDAEPYAVWLANNLAKLIDPAKELGDFETFFKKQRGFLQSEMADKYFLGRDMDLFEAAYDELKRVQNVPMAANGED